MTKQIKIATANDLSVAALFDAPAGSGPFPLVILLHGNTGWKEENHLATLAPILAASGIATLRFDAPGSGESDGTWADDYRVSNYLAAVKVVHDYAVSKLPIDPDRIGLWGHSMGGLVAVTAAAQIPGIAALCGTEPSSGQATTVNAAKVKAWEETGWRDLQTDIFGVIRLPFAYYTDRAQYNGLKSIRDVHAPVLLIAGTHDTSVTVASVKALYEAANEPKTYVEFPMDHNYMKEPELLEPVTVRTVEFFSKHLLR